MYRNREFGQMGREYEDEKMSSLIFQSSYIVIIPSYYKTDIHKHPFLHLFAGKKSCRITVGKENIWGNIILLDSSVRHAVEVGNNCTFFLLIDPTSIIAEQIREQYIKGGSYCNVSDEIAEISEDIHNLPENEIIRIVENMFLAMGISTGKNNVRDERIELIISKVISGEWLSYSVKQIAEKVFLSESRLTHLFKEEAGISLKSYILIRRMEYAYRLVSTGGKITWAAQESGFSSSAHLAYTCKKLTGVSITDVLK